MSQREIAQAAGKLTAANRYNHPPEQRDAARRDLATARIAAYVERVLHDAPELTREQRERIAALLRPVNAR